MKPPPTISATLSLRVQPGARHAGVVGPYGDALKIAITAPAVDGKANDALIRLLASLLHVPATHIEILSGQTSRSKLVRVNGLSLDAAQRLLLPET